MQVFPPLTVEMHLNKMTEIVLYDSVTLFLPGKETSHENQGDDCPFHALLVEQLEGSLK